MSIQIALLPTHCLKSLVAGAHPAEHHDVVREASHCLCGASEPSQPARAAAIGCKSMLQTRQDGAGSCPLHKLHLCTSGQSVMAPNVTLWMVWDLRLLDCREQPKQAGLLEKTAMNEQPGGHRNVGEPSAFCFAEGLCWRDGAQSHRLHEGTICRGHEQ